MLVTHTLDFVSRKAALSRPRYSREIAARRTQLSKSGTDIDEETKSVIYPKLLSRLETGIKDPKTLTVAQLDALLKTLQWTPQEFYEATGVEVPGGLRVKPTPTVREIPSRVRVVPVYRVVVPRQGEGTSVRDGDDYIPIEEGLQGDVALYKFEGEFQAVAFLVVRQRRARVGVTVICDLEGVGVTAALVTAIEGDMVALTDIRGKGHLVRNPDIKGVAIKKLEDLPDGLN